LVVSFTLTPLLASRFFGRERAGRKEAKLGWLAAFADRWERSYRVLEGLYRVSLEAALRRRGRVILVATASFFLALFLLSRVGGEFMPTLDEGFVRIEIEMPPGSSLEETDRAVRRVEAVLDSLPETVSILSTIGGQGLGVENAVVLLKIVPKSEREMGIVEYANRLKPKLASIPDADVRVKVSSERTQEQADIVIDIMGPDLETLEALGRQVYDSVATVPGLAALRTSVEEGKPEIVFRPDRAQLDRFGIPSAAVAMALRAGYEGEVASRYREGEDEYDIRVRYREDQRARRADFFATRVMGQDAPVPITQLGTVTLERSPREILRRNRQKLVRVEANVGSGTLTELVAQIRRKLSGIDFPPGYRVHYGGMVELQEESFSSLFTALILAIILTYMVLAGVLESFLHPITVMTTLPLGLVGMAVALFLSGNTVNIFSLMALIMLVGIVVNNAILLLDYTAVLRRRGMKRREALLAACPVRLRPIVIANLAITIGMLPQALAGAGSEFRAVMAIVTMGGVIVSALFTLYLIPVIYDLLDRSE
jgi:HAE1 family hydrophobic/amphiphilic exporter-1